MTTTSENGVVSILSPSTPMHYRGDALMHGVGLDSSPNAANVDFKLAGKFDRLSGTIYADDEECGTGGPLTISDSSDPAHLKVLFTATLPPMIKRDFSIPVHGITYLHFEQDSGSGCYGDTGKVAIVATLTTTTGTTTHQSPKAPTMVVARYPANNSAVSANSKVLVGWQPFPGAATYLFHVWVVNTDASATLTAKTPLAFSATVYHATKYTWNDAGFPLGTYQYALLPLDAKGKALSGWSAPVQITVAS